MNGRCTCGVELVEGARFCHKCGRPVDGFEPMIVEPPPLPVVDPMSQAVQLQAEAAAAVVVENRVAVRSGLTAAGILFIPVLLLSPLLGAPIMAVAPLLMGTLAVFLHSRRTGRGLSIIEGARQGWISGLFFFLMILVLLTLTFLLISLNADVIPQIREQAKANGTLTPETALFFDRLKDPAQLIGPILMSIALSFVMFTSLSSLGGILGTRIFGGARRTN